MSCKITQGKMIEYIDNTLYPGERSDFELHMCACETCRSIYQEMKAFSDTCAEFIVYPEKPYPFNILRARMAAIRPLDEVVAYLPKMRAPGLAGRFATALLLLFFVALLPSTVRTSRDTCNTIRRSFTEEIAKWEPEYQEVLDKEYRQKMAEHFSSVRQDPDSV